MHWSTVSHPIKLTKFKVVVAVLSSMVLSSIMLGSLFGCTDKPPVKIQRSRDTVRVDLQTLGEYPTTISHVRLRNVRTGNTVWEIKTRSGTPQLHALTFKEGENPVALADPDSGTYTTLTPADSKTFQLNPAESYELEIWKHDQSSPAQVSISFAK